MNRFLVADYRPTETDVVVSYTIQPLRNDSFHECLHELGAFLGFSITRPLKIFDLHQESFACKIAYPEAYFESENLPQNLSVIGGKIFEFPQATSIKIRDIFWPKNLEKAFSGPLKGIHQLRAEMNIWERPLSCGMLLPHSSATIKECLEKSYLMWMGGCDMVMDSDMMTAARGEKFEDRIDFLSNEMVNCESRSKSAKRYIPNITAGTISELQQRAQHAKKAGVNIVALNGIQAGWNGILSGLKICHELHLDLMVHQQGIGHITRGSFGWSTAALAKIYRMIGVEFLALDASLPDIDQAIENLTSFQELIKTTFPIYTKDTHPAEIEQILKHHGYDLVLQIGNGIEQHPDGVKAGAEALQYAIEMATQGIELDAAIKKNEPLRRAVENWSRMIPSA
ncbi:MAG: RuBisCO large subunit C-terminal-like domain-containing protein [Candidatus Altimarinota bacterium]